MEGIEKMRGGIVTKKDGNNRGQGNNLFFLCILYANSSLFINLLDYPSIREAIIIIDITI